MSKLSTVGEVTEQVAVNKKLSPNNYGLYLVIGDAVSGMLQWGTVMLFSHITGLLSFIGDPGP